MAVLLHLELIGDLLETIGFVLISLPLVSIVTASLRIKNIAKMSRVSDEIRSILVEANYRYALWPKTSELVLILFGFLVHLAGLLAHLARSIQA